jgi:hypothetical protein
MSSKAGSLINTLRVITSEEITTIQLNIVSSLITSEKMLTSIE